MPLVPADSIAGRALVVVIAIMTFLACLTAGGAILVGEASQAWRGDVSRDVTIQIKPRAGEDVDAVVAAAAEIASRAPGVADARRLHQGAIGGDPRPVARRRASTSGNCRSRA